MRMRSLWGAGLAGLVAAAELAEAWKLVIIVDQELPLCFRGQASWLSAACSWSIPEKARVRRQRLVRVSSSATGWGQPASIVRKTSGRGGGPRHDVASPPVRHGRGCISRECAGFRSWAGPAPRRVWGVWPRQLLCRRIRHRHVGHGGPGVLEPFVRGGPGGR